MPASILTMKSPTGVTDFLHVSQGALDKNLNSSFSWVECPIDVEDSRKLGIAEQIQAIEQRLKWLEAQSMSDKQDFYEQLRRAKSEARDELYKKYEPLLTKSNSQYDGQVVETSKIINYLRDDNAKLREEMKTLKRNIAKLTKANEELEAANASAEASHADLKEYVEGLEAMQDKLNNNCRVYKNALTQMKQDYAKRDAYYTMEVNTMSKYEYCLAKVLTQVQKSPRGASLERELFQMAEEGALEVAAGREEQLKKVGLIMDERQRKQTDMLMNPDLLIARQKRRNAVQNKSNLDSDSDSSESEEEIESDEDE